MIRRVSAPDIAIVSANVSRIGGCETPQAIRRKQLSLDHGQNPLRPRGRDHGIVEAQRQYLIWTYRSIACIGADNIIQTIQFLIPKLRVEAPLRSRGQAGI